VKYYIGIDIGGTKCAASLGIYDGSTITIADKNKTATVTGKPYDTLDALTLLTNDILKRNSLNFKDISGIGISCGGPLDSKKGIVQSPPNLPGWDNIEVVEYFEKQTGIPTALQNDANACALAEWKFGAGKGCENMIFLTFGTGLGAGLILNGKLYSGRNDMAGEIGQIRLSKHATADDFCSSDGIRKLTFKKLDELKELGIEHPLQKKGNYLSAFDVFEAAKQGDKLAMQIIRTSAEKLGHLIACIADFLNPEAVIIGNYYARNAEVLLPIIREVVDREANPISSTLKILPSKLGDSIWDLGALMCAL